MTCLLRATCNNRSQTVLHPAIAAVPRTGSKSGLPPTAGYLLVVDSTPEDPPVQGIRSSGRCVLLLAEDMEGKAVAVGPNLMTSPLVHFLQSTCRSHNTIPPDTHTQTESVPHVLDD